LVAVLHAIANLRASAGGPPRSVAALVGHLADQRPQVCLFTRRIKEPEVPVAPSVSRFFGESAGGFWKSVGLDAGRRAQRDVAFAIAASHARLVHSHGIWTPACHAVAAACTEAGVPLVISVRGMLETVARSSKAAKKSLAWLAYQRQDLARATAIHATSEAEVESIRQCGLRQPVVVLPNGVVMPPTFPSRPIAPTPVRTALFLSRIHPIKGLPLLIEAWNMVRPAGWRLVIVGNDDGGHRAEVAAMIERLGLQDVVSLGDAVAEADKWRHYAAADLSILPTRSESFGLAIAEAMLAGLPVITTHGAPWRILQTHGVGWWVPASVEHLATALTAATAMSSTELAAMGRGAAELARREFDWRSIAARFWHAYDWLLDGGLRPGFVHLS
jgi:glycosyltransferase involved in cell wall biosynthesis